MIVAVGNDGQFARLVAVLGAPELASDSRFVTNPLRVENRAVLVPRLTELTLRFTRDGLLGASQTSPPIRRWWLAN